MKERERKIVPDRQNKEAPRQPDRVARIGVIGVCACMCVSVCHNACYGPQSSIGWPQLSWSHWRRFHRSVQRYSAILPGPKGASTSTHTLLHTHTQTHKDMHIHTHKFENTTDSHFYTKKHTAQL